MINSESTNEENTKTEKLVTLSTIAMCGIKLIKSMLKDEKIEKRNLLRLKKNRMMSDLLQNEQISNLAQKDAVENINNVNINKIDIDTKIENNKFLFNIGVNLFTAMVSGMYLNQHIKQNSDGKIDGKSLAAAIISLSSVGKSCRNFVNSIEGIKESKGKKRFIH